MQHGRQCTQEKERKRKNRELTTLIASHVQQNLHGRRWRIPEVQLRDCQYAGDMAVAAIASVDEANGWLKPEKTRQRGKRGQGRGP